VDGIEKKEDDQGRVSPPSFPDKTPLVFSSRSLPSSITSKGGLYGSTSPSASMDIPILSLEAGREEKREGRSETDRIECGPCIRRCCTPGYPPDGRVQVRPDTSYEEKGVVGGIRVVDCGGEGGRE